MAFKKTNRKTVVAININCFIPILSSPICLQFVFIREIKHTVYPVPSPHTALTCCTVVTCFSKELISIFHLIETFSMMQMFTEDPDFSPLLRFSTFLVYICAFLLLCVRPVQTSWGQEWLHGKQLLIWLEPRFSVLWNFTMLLTFYAPSLFGVGHHESF